MNLKIGIDTEGLDRGFEVAIEGAKEYLSRNNNYEITLYILEENLEKVEKLTSSIPNLHIRTSKLGATTQVKGQDLLDDIKNNLTSSPKCEFKYTMSQAIYDTLTKEVDLCIIPGHAAHLSLIARTLERNLDISNPLFPQAFGTFIPNRKNQTRIMLDLGAFISQDLFKLAVLGEEFLKYCYKIKKVKVGFLNIGSEETKGPLEIREAASVYKKYNPESIFGQSSFIEPDKIFGKNDCNVVVCNALNGNLVLKAAEGTFRILFNLISDASKESILKRILGFFSYYFMKNILETFNPEKYNCAVAFGFSPTITKVHGDSSIKGIFYAIEKAISLHEHYGDFYSYFKEKTKELFGEIQPENMDKKS